MKDCEALIVQLAQRRIEIDTITLRIKNFKTPGMNEETLTKGKEFIEYLMKHNQEKIKIILHKAPFTAQEVLNELARKADFDDKSLFLVQRASKNDLEKVIFMSIF